MQVRYSLEMTKAEFNHLFTSLSGSISNNYKHSHRQLRYESIG